MHTPRYWKVGIFTALFVGCSSRPPGPSSDGFASLIPVPESVAPSDGAFAISADTTIYVDGGNTELAAIGHFLADRLGVATGYHIAVSTDAPPANGSIHLTTGNADPSLGEEGYVLTSTPDSLTVTALQPTGLFRGVQTIMQLLPPAIESNTVQDGPWLISAGVITDRPRFAWRGMMLDVARHFFSVADVKTLLDNMAYYKLNRLHLHLSDDQGWRIVINSWPNLAMHGGSTSVGGGAGGYFTQADYSDIVDYARRLYITVVPEIDMPGHTNAALASYAALNCDGQAPPLFTGTTVTALGNLCTSLDETYMFVEQVLTEIAALTPGPYLHIGGDEVTQGDYVGFIDRVQPIVQSLGKQMIGWGEISKAHLMPTSIAQHWLRSQDATTAVQQGAQVIMSPAAKMYMDMKYNSSTTLGQAWAGYIDVQDAYSWDPATLITGVSEQNILGIEAPLWTETIQSMADVEQMTFPRLPGYAEIGWSPQAARDWDNYSGRLASHGPRLTNRGIQFYRSTQVAWE